MRIPYLLLVAVALGAACGDSTGNGTLTLDDVAGAYHATRFEREEGGIVTDELALGASIDLTLAANGSTTGTLFVPMGNSDGTDFQADLTGTWTLNGQAVTLSHPSATFLVDVVFAYTPGTLSGASGNENFIIRVTLAK